MSDVQKVMNELLIEVGEVQKYLQVIMGTRNWPFMNFSHFDRVHLKLILRDNQS